MLLLLATVCVGVAAGCGGGNQPQQPPPPSHGATIAKSPSVQPADAFNQIPNVVRRLEPSVVTVLTPQGLGSGIVWSADGIIVTDNHVVAGNQNVTVAFADGRRSQGQVRAADPVTDLAVVQTDRKGLPKATFQGALPQVGEIAIAVGSPLGFQGSVTAGIISGVHRQIPGSAQQGQPLIDLLQTDAPISPGNSGGALVNANSQVVGVNEAFIPPSQGAVSLGFAIPSQTVINVVEQLLQTGHARHSFAGIQPGSITPEIAAQLGLPRTTGVLVLSVVPQGPADKAGVQPGDVITSVDGTPTDTVESLLANLNQHQPGDTVTLQIQRQGAEQAIKVTLADRPPSQG
jgi:S1-C subfamily serine protease